MRTLQKKNAFGGLSLEAFLSEVRKSLIFISLPCIFLNVSFRRIAGFAWEFYHSINLYALRIKVA